MDIETDLHTLDIDTDLHILDEEGFYRKLVMAIVHNAIKDIKVSGDYSLQSWILNTGLSWLDLYGFYIDPKKMKRITDVWIRKVEDKKQNPKRNNHDTNRQPAES